MKTHEISGWSVTGEKKKIKSPCPLQHKILILGVFLLEDLLGRWDGRENHGWFFPWQGQHLNNSSLQRCVSPVFCLKPQRGFEFLLLVFGKRGKNLGASGIVFARNLDCFLITFRAIQSLHFSRERNKLQTKACLEDGSQRESLLLP